MSENEKAQTVTMYASADYGLHGQYVARITGRDPKFTFRRDFIGRKYGKRNEGTSAMVDEPGLYEIRDVTRKGNVDKYRLIVMHDGGLQKLTSERADAMRIARALEEGRELENIVRLVPAEDGGLAYEILSAVQAERADKAHSIESAEAECWQILQALPPKHARKVLAMLRARLAPPKAEPEASSNTAAAPVDAAPAASEVES